MAKEIGSGLMCLVIKDKVKDKVQRHAGLGWEAAEVRGREEEQDRRTMWTRMLLTCGVAV